MADVTITLPSSLADKIVGTGFLDKTYLRESIADLIIEARRDDLAVAADVEAVLDRHPAPGDHDDDYFHDCTARGCHLVGAVYHDDPVVRIAHARNCARHDGKLGIEYISGGK